MSLRQVDIALVEISYSGGSKELKTVMDINIDTKDPKAAVKTMNRKRRAIGRTRGVPEYDVTLRVAQLMGTPEVDWFDLQTTGEEFLITYEEGNGGKRYSLIDVTIDDVSKPFKADGQFVMDIKCTALDHKSER